MNCKIRNSVQLVQNTQILTQIHTLISNFVMRNYIVNFWLKIVFPNILQLLKLAVVGVKEKLMAQRDCSKNTVIRNRQFF